MSRTFNESLRTMKPNSTINLIGGTLTLAMSLAIASVGQSAWADDMTQPVAAVEVVQASDVIALQAIFMDVQGKVRWRINQDAPWTVAKVNDLLDAGAEIRTGLKSRSTLRVGKNATILVDAGTTFKLPEMVQDGQTLRTLATVKSGRADFKVDHVGFANDFKVITPQTTLSVRGTGFGLASGPLKGVDVSGANTNSMNAIEVKYIAANMAYFVSGQGKTSSESGKQDPVQNAWVSTIGPPPIAGTMVSQSDVQQQVAQGTAGVNPSSNTQQIQQTQAGEANENAIDTALVLASDSGGGGGTDNVNYGESIANAITSLNDGAVTNAGVSNQNLNVFNLNLDRWENSLSSANALPSEMQEFQTEAATDLVTSNSILASMDFESTLYFDRSYGEGMVITGVGLEEGRKLNGASNSLLSLGRDADARTKYAFDTYNQVTATLNTAFVDLKLAESSLSGLSTNNAISLTQATALSTALVQMNTYLSNLRGLVGSEAGSNSQSAYSKIAELTAMATKQVVQGLAAAKQANENYNNASSRADKEYFSAQAQRYTAAAAQALSSFNFITNQGTEGEDGIQELAAKIMLNLNLANNRFDYQSFVNYAQPYVQDQIDTSGIIRKFASVSMSASSAAEAQLADGSQNKKLIDAQLLVMLNQVDWMERKAGMSYVGGSEGKTLMTGMAGFAFKSNADRIASNEFKINFYNLFDNGAGQSALTADLNGLRELAKLYSGGNSIQEQANTLLGEIRGHSANAITANSAITGLTETYTANMATANFQAAQANAGFSQQFANSRAIANQYLNDFKTIVGSNNSDAARTALAAVTALVGDQIRYVDQAEAAVSAAEAASRKAHSRGEMVYMNAVATQMARAATIQLASNTAMFNIAANGTVIQNNYSQAQDTFNSLGGSSSSNNN